jgi:2-(1,2-epoxy-1,2-dihydrophenyl)acetyl-CoA isomerase
VSSLAAAMYPAFRSILGEWATDDDVGCVLLTAVGTAFCAGGDIKDGGARREGPRPSHEVRVDGLLGDATTARLLHEHPKVVLGALPGPAVGAGLSLALACDLRIAARRTRLVTGWGRLALSGDFGGTWFLTRLLGPARALELLLSGDPVDADAALALGLVNRVVDDDQLEAEGMAWARKIAAGPTVTWRYMKQNVHAALDLDLPRALAQETVNMVRSSSTKQHGEAVRAAAEGRTPVFRPTSDD